MLSSSLDYFFYNVQIPLLGVLLFAVGVLLALRIWGIRRSNADFPSRWRTASVACLVFAGVLLIAHLGLWTANLILLKSTDRIEREKGPVRADWTATTFTEEERWKIARAENAEFRIQLSARVILLVALWVVKAAFIFSFLATSPYLPRLHLRALYVVSGITVVSFAFSLWASTYEISYDPLPSFTADDVVPAGLTGLVYLFYDQKWEYTMTALNLVTDVLCYGVACLIIRSLPAVQKGRSVWLLLSMLLINLGVASARMALVYQQFHDVNSLGDNPDSNGNSLAYRDMIKTVLIIITECEILLNAVTACIPGLRAWTREHRPTTNSPDSSSTSAEKGARETNTQSDGTCSQQSLDFITATEGSEGV